MLRRPTLALSLALVTLLAGACGAEEESDAQSGEVMSGLDRSRSLPELSTDETTNLCNTIAAARQSMLDELGLEAMCTFQAVVSSHALTTESGLEQARATCRSIREQCLGQPIAVTCEGRISQDLADWSACGIGVGEVEACESAENSHTRAEIEHVRDTGITCDTLDENSVVTLPDDAVDDACPNIYVCDA